MELAESRQRELTFQVVESWHVFSAHAAQCERCEILASTVRTYPNAQERDLEVCCDAGGELAMAWFVACKTLSAHFQTRR